MRKLILAVLSFAFIFSVYLSPANAAHSGKMSFLLGEDYDYIKSNYTHDPDAQYSFEVDSQGYDCITCFYKYYDITIFEVLYFNDEKMSTAYTIFKTFNDYNELMEEVKVDDAFLHEKGNVLYRNGLAYTETWEFSYLYKVEGYTLMFVKRYTPRGEYKASLDLIDSKFDRIQRGYY